MATFTDADVIEVEIIAQRDTYDLGSGDVAYVRQRRVEWRLTLRASEELMRDGGWWDELLWMPHGIRLRPDHVDMRSDITRDLAFDVRAEVIGEVTNQQVMNALAASRGRRRSRVVDPTWDWDERPRSRERGGVGITYGPASWASVADPMPPREPEPPPKPAEPTSAKIRERKRRITLDDD